MSSLVADQSAEDAAMADADDKSEDEGELPIQLAEIYEILLEIKSKSENSRVHEIMSWPSKKPSQIIKMVVEILCDDDSAQDILWWCASVPVWARSFVEGIATLVGDQQEVIRVWALRALWRLIPLFEAEQLMQDHILPMGGFVEMSLTALSRYPLTKPLYVALLELMLNQKSQTGHIEAMGQAIAKNGGQICEVVMKLIRDCTWDLRLEILKDINVLMIRREENVQVPANAVLYSPMLLSFAHAKTSNPELFPPHPPSLRHSWRHTSGSYGFFTSSSTFHADNRSGQKWRNKSSNAP
jgi:hypothetical protein